MLADYHFNGSALYVGQCKKAYYKSTLTNIRTKKARSNCAADNAVLKTLTVRLQPLTRQQIARYTQLDYEDVNEALKQLYNRGEILVYSRGDRESNRYKVFLCKEVERQAIDVQRAAMEEAAKQTP
jgi:hypothetical protein